MLVVVGGHSRNIGKTSLVCEVIRAFQGMQWQAFKITQHGHSVCNDDGEACGCAPGDLLHPAAVDEQLVADGTDTGRYLAAGAVRSWWVRTAQGELGYAMPELRGLFPQSANNIAESNSLLRFVIPDLYLVVVNFAVDDLKDSSRLFLDRADAFVQTGGSQPWANVPPRWFANKPVFAMPALDRLPEDLAEWLSGRFHFRPDAVAEPLRRA